jgi:hypothetical protein
MNLANLLQQSYEPQAEFKSNLEKKKEGKYDDSLSSMNSKVFVDNNNTPIIVHRGTSNMRDVVSDGLMFFGLQNLDPRFREAKRLNKKVQDKYGEMPVNIGHSYGGFLAERSAPKGGKVITYNKALGYHDIGRRVPDTQTDIRANNDLVSFLSRTQRHKKGNLQTVNSDTRDPFVAHKTRHINNIIFI